MVHPTDQVEPVPSAAEPASQEPLAIDYDRLRRQLLRSVTRVCPPWLADRREDIVQASLMRVMKALDVGKSGPAPPASYVWKVAYSATIDQIRKIRRRREVPLEEVGPGRRVSASAGGHPFEERALGELGLAIRQCLETVVESRRQVLGLHLLGHSIGEMTKLLRTNDKRVRNLLFRGLTDLRSCLSGRGFRP